MCLSHRRQEVRLLLSLTRWSGKTSEKKHHFNWPWRISLCSSADWAKKSKEANFSPIQPRISRLWPTDRVWHSTWVCTAYKLRLGFLFLRGTKKLFFLFLRFYLFIHERHTQKEAETQAEGEAGSSQGTRCGTRSRDPGIMPWAKGRHLTAEPPRHPKTGLYIF